MWHLLVMWLVRGGPVMTEPLPTDLPTLAPAKPVTPARTIADVEADLIIAGHVTSLGRAQHARAWPSRITENLADERPTYVRQLNSLIDEWAWWHYDDQPKVTRTGG